MKRILIFLPLFFVCCQDTYYRQAQVLEKSGKILEAANYYEKFSRLSKDEKLRPIALQKAAILYSQLLLCGKSSVLWEELARQYPYLALSASASKDVYICPPYFPSEKMRKMIYGDSHSYGKNAREEMSIVRYGYGGGLWEWKIYAGKKMIGKGKTSLYEKDFHIFEKKEGEDKKILKYPLRKGEEFSDGKRKILLSEIGLDVKTKAGEFNGCIKVYEYNQSQPSFRQVFYYAPFIGKIVTAIESQGKETRIMELISYEQG